MTGVLPPHHDGSGLYVSNPAPALGAGSSSGAVLSLPTVTNSCGPAFGSVFLRASPSTGAKCVAMTVSVASLPR